MTHSTKQLPPLSNVRLSYVKAYHTIWASINHSPCLFDMPVFSRTNIGYLDSASTCESVIS